jgi:hypothetical protein
MTSAWLAFWNGSHSIYVNGRHKDVHYRLIAEAIAALVPGRDACVLDYGCGEALHADRVAAVAGEVLLCEAAPYASALTCASRRTPRSARSRPTRSRVCRSTRSISSCCTRSRNTSSRKIPPLYSRSPPAAEVRRPLGGERHPLAACRGTNRRLRAPAVRRTEWISHRRRCGARAHADV